MKALINFMQGLKNLRSFSRLVLLLFVFNLLFSLILTIPMYNSLKNSWGNSLVSENMAQGFDYLWWEEYRDQSQGLEKTFTPAIFGKGAILTNLQGLVQMRLFTLPVPLLLMGLIYILLHTFFAGGILSLFHKKAVRFQLGDFFQGAGLYYIRFLGLLFVSWLFFFVVLANIHKVLYNWVDNIARSSFSEITPFYLNLLVSIFVLVAIFFLQMVFDYARILTVVEDKKNIIRSTQSAFAFILHNSGSAFGLYYLILSVQVVFTLLFIAIQNLIPQVSFFGVLLAFIWHQIFIFGIIWIRCWLYSSQLCLYKYVK